jgi:mono/diheme cytochrome c family protein
LTSHKAPRFDPSSRRKPGSMLAGSQASQNLDSRLRGNDSRQRVGGGNDSRQRVRSGNDSRSVAGRGWLIALCALAFSGCTDAAGYDLDYLLGKLPFLSTMRATIGYEAQVMPRMPAPGTVPVSGPNGAVPGMFAQARLDSAAATLTSPPATPASAQRGMVVYQNQCSPCHGAAGAGSGPVTGPGKFPLGPPLTSASAVGRSDGYLYSVIRVGRGLMPAYGDRIGHDDRWAVVAYLRQVQGGAGAPAAAPPVPAAGAPAPGTPAATGTAGQPPAR